MNLRNCQNSVCLYCFEATIIEVCSNTNQKIANAQVHAGFAHNSVIGVSYFLLLSSITGYVYEKLSCYTSKPVIVFVKKLDKQAI